MALLDLDDKISEVPLVAFDFETTGLTPGKDRIIEFGGVKFQNRVSFSTMEVLVDPGIPIPAEASRISGITNEMVAGCPLLETVLTDFLDFIHGSVLIAHNAGFDMGFLQAALQQQGLPPLSNPVVDTLRLARTLLPEQPSHKLQNLARFLGIDPGKAHRAKDDAAVCRDLFYACLSRAQSGTTLSLRQLLALGGLETQAGGRYQSAARN